MATALSWLIDLNLAIVYLGLTGVGFVNVDEGDDVFPEEHLSVLE